MLAPRARGAAAGARARGGRRGGRRPRQRGFDGVELVERLRADGELAAQDARRLLARPPRLKLRAEAAGFDLVVPRSRMAREGAALVERLATARTGRPASCRTRADVERLVRIPNSTSQRAQRAARRRSAPNAARRRERGATASSWPPARAVEPGSAAHRGHGALRVALRLAVAALQRADRRADHRRVVLERLARDAQHELRVRRRAVVVDAELADARPLLAQRDALDVPERRRAGDAPGQQRLDRLEADRDRAAPRRGRRRRRRRPSAAPRRRTAGR